MTKKDSEILQEDLELQHEQEEAELHKEEVDAILATDPLKYLLSEVEKEYIGDSSNVEMCIYSLLSLCPAITARLHLQHVGHVQSGKSHLGDTCESLLSPSMQFGVKHQSPKYLLYASKEISVKETLIIFDDATDNDIEVLKALGNNKGPASYGTVSNGKHLSLKLDAEPLIWFSTVSPLVDKGGQLGSRYILLNTADSDSHHTNILNNMKGKVSIGNTEVAVPISPITGYVISACVKNPDFDTVKVPEFEFPDRVDTQFRDAKAIISLIQSVAVLNFKNRTIRSEDRALIATDKDVEAALDLWKVLAPYNRMKISKAQRVIYDAICTLCDEYAAFGSTAIGATAKDISEQTGKKSSGLYVHLINLEEMGWIEKEGNVYYPC